MRHDRPARHPCIRCETPTGTVYEMDVWLDAEEIALVTHGHLMPSRDRGYEPWLRVAQGAEDLTSAGIEIVEHDDGA